MESGDFVISDLTHYAVIIIQALQGLDVPYIRDNLSDRGIDKAMLKDYMTNLLLNGIKKR